MKQESVIINNCLLPKFCSKCKFPISLKESDKQCMDICIHPGNRAFFETRDAEQYATRSCINYNESKITQRK